ncbi:histidine kinase [Erysipelotrichaceae bacterium OttesenSCG-928-M19]|nr:histidine kinase [Erysipelotrichaceae bacterium OttesenSCG-928-M19]
MTLFYKAVLLVISLVLMTQANISLANMALATLLLLTLSALDYYFSNLYFKLSYLIIILLLCYFNHEYYYFLPLLAYDTSHQKFYYLNNLAIIVVLLQANLPIFSKTTIIALISLSLIIHYLVSQKEALSQKLYSFQDQKNEMEIQLITKNKQLLSSQDKEVYYATLNERGRIAREIHDNVGHILSSSIIQLGAIKKLNKDTTLTNHLEQLDSSLNKSMNSIRDNVHNVHAQSLNLASELNNIVEDYLFCKIQTNYDISEFIPLRIKTTILAIIKEALNNTAKHSNATLVKISIRELEKHYQIIVVDNGNTTVKTNTGLGLASMQERVTSLNGILTITDDDGFKIHLTIPKE